MIDKEKGTERVKLIVLILVSILVPIWVCIVMSSLKDIMDVDVEPLESQAYRRRAHEDDFSKTTGVVLLTISFLSKTNGRNMFSMK
jgi:hypothetical protein